MGRRERRQTNVAIGVRFYVHSSVPLLMFIPVCFDEVLQEGIENLETCAYPLRPVADVGNSGE